MIATKMSPPEAAEMREDWVRAVTDLARQVTDWAEEQGWAVTRTEREIREETLGVYSVPGLTIDTHLPTGFPEETGQVRLEPVALNVFGDARGRVDLRAWPSFFRVMLLRQPDESWVVHTDSGIDWPSPWSQDTFLDLVWRLIRA